MEITAACPHCNERQTIHLPPGSSHVPCPHCQKEFVQYVTDAVRAGESVNQCPVCGSTHTYRQKDFNRNLGVALIVVGVLLAYVTYGLSLVAVTLIDWLLVRKVGEVGCCYRCHAQFRASPMIGRMDAFSLPLHDYYKNLRS